MAAPGTGAEAARRQVVERGLVPAAFGHLTKDAFLALPFEALGPTKALLKRFFSPEPWTTADNDALAEAVGPGEGRWERPLDDDLTLAYGWDAHRFWLGVRSTISSPAGGAGPGDSPLPTPEGGSTAPGADHDKAPSTVAPAVIDPPSPPGAEGAGGRDAGGDGREQRGGAGNRSAAGSDDPLAATFDGPVVPEATPNPRTIRFQVGSLHDGPSRWFESAPPAREEPAVARLFTSFPDVANVLVGPDFVAVGLHRPADWERLLRPVLAMVAEEFAASAEPAPASPRPSMGGPAGAGAPLVGAPPTPSAGPTGGRRPGRLEQAWQDLGSLRPADPADLARVLEATAGTDPSRRQVAASLLREADSRVASAEWARLAADEVRSVRRAAVDAMVDAGREELRPLLESALDDADAWVRWKALRGLAELGAGASRPAITGVADDRDFRVRLEAAAALRHAAG
ncbi:MAG: NifU N-terminal domain-containing protein [Acidimicrobiales bacterium]